MRQRLGHSYNFRLNASGDSGHMGHTGDPTGNGEISFWTTRMGLPPQVRQYSTALRSHLIRQHDTSRRLIGCR